MPATIRPSGPTGTVRPFIPVMGDKDLAERTAHASERLAVSLAALHFNVDLLTNVLGCLTKVLEGSLSDSAAVSEWRDASRPASTTVAPSTPSPPRVFSGRSW
jgi:hypothetical protein